MQTGQSNRREFLGHSGSILTGAALVAAISERAYAGENNTLQVALVGCGGRGTGAVDNALQTPGPTKLAAVADLFPDRLASSLRGLSGHSEKAHVPPQRRFIGFDAYKKAIDAVAPGGVVILATPPAFRPIHVEYAVERGCHVFMEKSFAVDVPGLRCVLKAGQEAARKNLKIAGGLMARHNPLLQEAMRRIHDGAIGQVVTGWACRFQGGLPFIPRRPGENELAHQIRNYSSFTWTNGSALLDWCVHDIDICCWAKDAWPVSAQGQGGRQMPNTPGQVFDHYAVEYTFADGTRLSAQGRHIPNCLDRFIDVVHGTKGSAYLASVGDGSINPKLYRSWQQTSENQLWPVGKHHHDGRDIVGYQNEHNLLFEAIRRDLPYNETERCVKSAMTGILGRMAMESGKEITWEQAMASNLELAPGLDQYSMDSPPPVTPDAAGRYAAALPGVTRVL